MRKILRELKMIVAFLFAVCKMSNGGTGREKTTRTLSGH